MGSDIAVSSGGKLVGRVSESVELVSGSAQLEAASAIGVMSGADVSVSAMGDVTGEASGALELGASSGSHSQGAWLEVWRVAWAVMVCCRLAAMWWWRRVARGRRRSGTA